MRGIRSLMLCVYLLACLSLLSLTVNITHGQAGFPELLPHQAIMVQWSLQGNLYATGHVDGSVRIYDDSGLIRTISNAHTAPVTGLTFSPDGSRLATGGYDNDVRIWSVSSGVMLAEFLDLGEYVETISWSPDSTTIWAASTNGMAYILSANISIDSYALLQEVSLGSSADGNWKPDSSLFAGGVRTIDIILFSTSGYTLIRSLDATPDTDFLQPPYEFTTSITWHPNANIVANGKINGWIHVWDLDSPSDTLPMLSLQANNGATDDALVPFEYRVVDIAFSGDGNTISSISSDGTLRVWNAETGALLSDTNLGETVLSAAFSPDGSRFVYNTYAATETSPTLVDLIPTCTTTIPAADVPALISAIAATNNEGERQSFKLQNVVHLISGWVIRMETEQPPN